MNYRSQPPESPPHAPDDSTYTGSDEEGSVEEQEAQKRRIHQQAQYYFQGEQLFILSAQLRGPFDVAWVNPWTEKRKRKGRDDGPGKENQRMLKGGDTMSSQGDHSMTISETTKPSRTWLPIVKAIRPEILETRLSSPTQTPEETLSTMTTLDPSAEDLQGRLKIVSPSTPTSESPPLIRKDAGVDVKFEKREARRKAREEMFRELSSKPTADMQKSKATSGKMATRNYEESPAQRLQEFNSKRREMYHAKNASEVDDKSKGPSNILQDQFNKTGSVKVERQLEAIPSQSAPRKRGRLEADDVPNNADGGAGAPVSKRPLKVNNGNKEITSSHVMIDFPSPFNVSDHGTSSLISPPRSMPSLFSIMGATVRNGGPKAGQKRPQFQPRSLGESGLNADSAITEILQLLKASKEENAMRENTTNP